jgi:AraC-like DNA-binding protein
VKPRSARAPDPHDIRSLSLTYYDGHCVPPHRHEWAQLVYARSGMIRLLAAGKLWFVPPTRAIWIPAQTEHQFSTSGEVAFRTLYISARRAAAAKREIGALEISPLLGEMIVHICSLEMLDSTRPADNAVANVLIDLINGAPPIDLTMPLPTDKRALRLVDRFQSRPDETAGLAILAQSVGASVRTLQRSFVTETGMTVNAWRQKARLIASITSLANGNSVTEAAVDCGYDSTSAYIAAFKRQFDTTPRQFSKLRT